MGEDRINYKLIIGKALKYWYLFAIMLLFTLGLAYLYLQYAQPKFEAEAMLLIKDEEKSSQLDEEAIFAELGLGKRKRNLENEVYVIRSTPLMQNVVEKLQLHFQYFSIDGIKKRDLYLRSPVEVVDWEPNTPDSYFSGKLTLEGSGRYHLECNKKDFAKRGFDKYEFRGEFGKELKLPVGKLTLARTQFKNDAEKIGLIVTSPKARADALLDELSVSIMGEKSSTLSLLIKDTSPSRAESVLMELIHEYNQHSIEDKNQVYKNSVDLINERIGLINAELTAAEQNVENYKQRFNVLELSAEGNMLVKELSDYNRVISGTEIQLEILNGIEDFLIENQETFEFVPTNLSINNLTLTNQLSSFNDLLRQREIARKGKGPSHPDVILLERQIQNVRQTIIDNIRAMKNDLQISLSANKGLKGDLESRMRSLPTQERELIEIERRKGVKENLYLYLLQKREESAISMAVTVPSGKVVEPAEAGDPVSPKGAQIWLIALFMGMAIPAGFVYLLSFMNDKVEMEDDIQQLTTVPVVGMLANSRKNGSLVIKEKSRSVEAEMFRLLRANLAYISPGREVKSVLVTSSISGEGKSYIALNLAVTQALTGKKVLLMELDLRKPKQEEMLNAKSKKYREATKKGIVDYLVNLSMSKDQVINQSEMHPNLDIITCGSKPPNPSELLLSNRLRELMIEMHDEYDFIIVDAPPVGLVADALQMKDLTEATMYVVRTGYTRKSHLQIIRDIAQKNKLPRPFIVLNSVPLNEPGGYGSGYGYAYVSSNGYYEKE